MDVFEAIDGRRSVRAFKDEPVSESHLRRILEAGLAAPSAGNLRARHFIVVKDAETRKKLAKAALGQRFIAQAPVSIVACTDVGRIKPYGERGRELYCIQDSAASVENMLLAIHALGLGSCWVGAFDENEVSKILSLPEERRPVAILPIGVPSEKPRGRRIGRSDEEISAFIPQ